MAGAGGAGGTWTIMMMIDDLRRRVTVLLFMYTGIIHGLRYTISPSFVYSG